MPDNPIPPRLRVSSPMWVVPLAFGGVIFAFGILIWVMPELLAYIVGAAFCAIGLSIMGLAWRMRPRARPGGPGAAPRDGSYVEFRAKE